MKRKNSPGKDSEKLESTEKEGRKKTPKPKVNKGKKSPLTKDVFFFWY